MALLYSARLCQGKQVGNKQGNKDKGEKVGVKGRRAAEKGGKGMALRIFTGAKPFLKALSSGITERGMLPHLTWIFENIRGVPGCISPSGVFPSGGHNNSCGVRIRAGV